MSNTSQGAFGSAASLIGTKTLDHDDATFGRIRSAKVSDMGDVPVGTLCFCYFTTYCENRDKIARGTPMFWLGAGRFLTSSGICVIHHFMWVSWWV